MQVGVGAERLSGGGRAAWGGLGRVVQEVRGRARCLYNSNSFLSYPEPVAFSRALLEEPYVEVRFWL